MKKANCFGTTNGLKVLRTGGRRATYDVQTGRTPVRGHLTASRGWVGLGSHRLKQHFLRSHAHGEREGAVAIIQIEPVVSGPQNHAGCDVDRLVSGAADLEENPVLALEENFPVIQAAGEVHEAKGAQQVIAPE